MIPTKFHLFSTPVSSVPLPGKFTYPFHYIPHPLCVAAAHEVQHYLTEQLQWQEELSEGKMFGVLIVQTDTGETGYLAAFSGNLAGSNDHIFFVPSIYDLLQPEGFFRIEEDQISAINARINEIHNSDAYLISKQKLNEGKQQEQLALDEAKSYLKNEKEKREQLRLTHPNETSAAALIRESQFQKAEYKRLKQVWEKQIKELQQDADAYDIQIENLKAERKRRSAALQLKLFGQFRILNARGEIRDLPSIFEETAQKVPPSGAGECAAPKLLQYAFLHRLRPVAMAEFWWGNSPKAEIRRHSYYYPACKGKCEPILRHMLQGLDVEENPLSNNLHKDTELEILYEDKWLAVINKPAGMLSVPGKTETGSVYERIKISYPNATGPLIVHRLDMATSGLLLIAKTKEVHQHLQAQFKNRSVKKRYIALLDGSISEKEGLIELPLRLDPEDRPRQVVDAILGKPAITKYKVLASRTNQSRVAFFPLTGRTHQLRVHAAHPSGLNAPIIGDELYGKKADRLYLHAEQLEFIHPVTGKLVVIEKKADF